MGGRIHLKLVGLPLTCALTDADHRTEVGPMDGCRGPDGAIYCIPSLWMRGFFITEKTCSTKVGLGPRDMG